MLRVPERLRLPLTTASLAGLVRALERASMGLRPGGFGMLIARQVADELVYNERRNEVLMIKHLD